MISEVLPYFNIQCDWNASLRGGKSWVSIKRPGQEKSIQCDLKFENGQVLSDSLSPHFTKADVTSNSTLTVTDEEDYECTFISPFMTFDKIHKKGIISMDVSSGGLGVSVCLENQLKIWESKTGAVRRLLDGHGPSFETTFCRFFPSGIVILTAGTDFSCKVISAENGENPVTFKGHTSYISNFAFVERGKNVITVSNDGSAKLWDCSSSNCIDTIFKCESKINSCILMSNPEIDLGHPISKKSDLEFGTDGKLLIMAREDNHVTSVSVSSRKQISNMKIKSPANCIEQIGVNYFSVGCQNGQSILFDIRKINSPVKEINFTTESPILDLTSYNNTNPGSATDSKETPVFWIAKNDGTCILAANNNKRLIQLSGSDFDTISSLAKDENYIYSACKDGLIRKYRKNIIDNILNQQQQQ